jgi:hypothetical protein
MISEKEHIKFWEVALRFHQKNPDIFCPEIFILSARG